MEKTFFVLNSNDNGTVKMGDVFDVSVYYIIGAAKECLCSLSHRSRLIYY